MVSYSFTFFFEMDYRLQKYDAYYKIDRTDIKRDFPTYMFLKSEFVYLDYISIMVMCVFKIHYFSNLLDKSKRI